MKRDSCKLVRTEFPAAPVNHPCLNDGNIIKMLLLAQKNLPLFARSSLHRVCVAGGLAQTSTLLTVCKRCFHLSKHVAAVTHLEDFVQFSRRWQPARSWPRPQNGTLSSSQCDVVCARLSARVGSTRAEFPAEVVEFHECY